MTKSGIKEVALGGMIMLMKVELEDGMLVAKTTKSLMLGEMLLMKVTGIKSRMKPKLKVGDSKMLPKKKKEAGPNLNNSKRILDGDDCLPFLIYLVVYQCLFLRKA